VGVFGEKPGHESAVRLARRAGKLLLVRDQAMGILTQKTDPKGQLQLPADFADCLVAVERMGDELRVRKLRQGTTRRYSFKQLMAGVTAKNIHAEIQTGPAGS
jgi:hypothetical protein